MATAVCPRDMAEKLYTIHRYENGPAAMNLVFRDHTISDLIGFVYSGMPPAGCGPPSHQQHQGSCAAGAIKRAETPWSRSFSTARMRGNTIRDPAANFCADFMTRCSTNRGLEAVTISEAIARHKDSTHVLAGSGFVDQCEFQRLDRRAGRQPGVGLSASRPRLLYAACSRGLPKHNASWRWKKS